MPRKTPGRESITTIYTDKQYEQIKILAAKSNTSMNEIVRGFVEQGLDGIIGKENIDIITKIMREQLKDTIHPYMERLAALSAKSCVQSSTAAYLTAETILKFVSDEEKEEVQEVYERARKKAIQYTKNKAEMEEW